MALSEASPDWTFTTPGLLSPDGVFNQFPPLVVTAVADHVNAEPGVPAFVTVTGVVAAFAESRVTVLSSPVICMFASGIQRIVNAAEVLMGPSVSVRVGVTWSALAMVLNALSKESCAHPIMPAFCFSAIGTCSRELKE